MGSLTIVTGTPGTRIRRSLESFAEYSQTNHGHHIAVHSVEVEFQKRARPRVEEFFEVGPEPTVVQTFLLPRQLIRELWLEAFSAVWEEVEQSLVDGDAMLTLHLSFFHHLTREYFIPADVPLLTERVRSSGAKVVTLVDDIYDCHQSLIAGGSGAGMLDPPSSIERAVLDLLLILDWRSMEVMLSESLASSAQVPARIFAVKHPLETFHGLLYSEKRLIYLSHPISEPRRALLDGDEASAKALVAGMAQMISRLQAESTVIEPTRIDELRFITDEARLSPRWPFSADARELLYTPPDDPPPTGEAFLFPVGWDEDGRGPLPGQELIKTLRSAIESQIDARDHGLVDQADFIACYRPIYEGHVSRGVREELQHFGRLAKLGLRDAATASVVFSPPGDQEAYPRRLLTERLIPGWRRTDLLLGDESAFATLVQELEGGGERALKVINGEVEALRGALAAAGVFASADASSVPSGALGATEASRRQATEAMLSEQIRRASASYLELLEEEGVVQIVENEQMFYAAAAQSQEGGDPDGQ